MAKYPTIESIRSYLKVKYKKKHVLNQIKEKRDIKIRSEEKRAKQIETNENKEVEHSTGFSIRFRNSKKSLMLTVEIENDRI